MSSSTVLLVFLYLIALSMVIKEVQADEAVLSKRQYQDGKIILFCKIYQSLTTTVVQIVLLSESTLISPDGDLQYAVETSRSNQLAIYKRGRGFG